MDGPQLVILGVKSRSLHFVLCIERCLVLTTTKPEQDLIVFPKV
jgi:hypothetical protein